MKVLTAYRLGPEGNHNVPVYSHGPWWLVALLSIGACGMRLYLWADQRMVDDDELAEQS